MSNTGKNQFKLHKTQYILSAKVHTIVNLLIGNTKYTYMKHKNQTIINQLALYYNWSEITKNNYTTILNKYSKYHNLTLEELINEAEKEEDIIPKTNKRTIKTRLFNYIITQKENKLQDISIKQELSMIKKMYKHYDIEIPRLPPLRPKQSHESFHEIPSREEIYNILLNVNLKQKSIITFMASTGLRRSDVCNLKIKDFIKSLHEYTQSYDLLNIITEIENSTELVIPKWEIHSQKTKVNYITFSSDESTKLICRYLKQRLFNEQITNESSLFDMKPHSVSVMFERINDKFQMGFVGHSRFFHPHVLRKYFTTSLYNDGVDFLFVDFLAGHTLSPIRAAYYKANPEELKRIYIEHLHCLTFMSNVEFVDRGISNVEHEELVELRAYKEETDKRLEALESMIKSFLE